MEIENKVSHILYVVLKEQSYENALEIIKQCEDYLNQHKNDWEELK